MDLLERQLDWFLNSEQGARQKFTSIFLGGGTPGMLSREYEGIFRKLKNHIAPDCEISIETNPEDIQPDILAQWHDLGINRISMGVQTFQERGLEVLTRNHGSIKAQRAIEEVLKVFSNLNIDLIYGWPDQSVQQWRQDLEQAAVLGVPHLSLYNLTYEAGTPLNRKKDRGMLQDVADEHLESLYQTAMMTLSGPWIHDEVSNWSLPGFSCKHNWLYWQDSHYLGLGCGAHGYLPVGEVGLRYAFPKQLRTYLRAGEGFVDADITSLEEFLISHGASIDEGRTLSDWLLELIGCSLRSRKGVPVNEIEKLLKCKFEPGKILQTGIDMGLVKLEKGQLYLEPSEWFRETSWATELVMAFES